MNRSVLFRCLLFCFAFFAGFCTQAQQTRTQDSLPYQKFPTLPAFDIRLPDSGVFNTYYIPEGRASVIMYFSPDCDHCEMQVDTFINHMDELRQVRFYLVTPLSLAQLRSFRDKLHLKRYPNIVTGRDEYSFIPKFFGVSYVPYIVVYDKQKKLVRSFEGGVKMADLLQALEQ